MGVGWLQLAQRGHRRLRRASKLASNIASPMQPIKSPSMPIPSLFFLSVDGAQKPIGPNRRQQ